MNELQIFKSPEFGEIRTVTRDGQPWFVGKDIAEVLGYNNTRDALAKRVDNEDKLDGVAICDSIGREQKPVLINESGLYSLILSSKLPAAKKFKRWVTSDVLPMIRKTGSYSKHMTEYQTMIANTRSENAKIRKAQILTRLAEQYNGTYRQVLNSYATKELTGEHLLPLPELPRKTYTAAEIGDKLGISANKVGVLTNRHDLKTEQYGAWFCDKAKSCNKEVQSFRYFDNVIDALRRFI